jgi:acyl-CoA synthetase (AMP-forming)/AMP-acid ligase II
MRTGDLGFLKDGELFVTGRIKDLLIIRGRNLYPQDIEKTVEKAHPALRVGAGAAFSVDHAGEEKLVIVQELDRAESKSAPNEELIQGLLDSIRAQIFENHDLHVHAISLIRSNSIPMTSSGKIQRQATRRLFLDGGLQELKRFEQISSS